MAINFPDSPSISDTYVYNGKTWVYNGVAWEAVGGGNVAAASPFSADNRLLRSDGTGKAIQDSGIALDDTTFAMYPATNDVGTLGKGGNAWGDLFLASGGVINWNAGDVTLTHSADLLTFSSGNASAMPYAFNNTGGPSGIIIRRDDIVGDDVTFGALRFHAKDSAGNDTLYCSINGRAVSDDDGAEVGALLFAAATSGTNANRMRMDVASLSPMTTDTMTLGTTSLMWSDLFLASGGVINWNNGDVTITHSTDALTFAAANASVPQWIFSNTGNNCSLQLTRPEVVADNVTIGNIRAQGLDDASNTQVYCNIAFTMVSDVNGAEQGDIKFGCATGGTNANRMIMTAAALSPSTTDALALGTSSLMWSDLFLASGGVINFNNGDITIGHSSDMLTFDGGLYQLVRTGNANYYNLLNVLNQSTGSSAQAGIQIGTGTAYFQMYHFGSGWAGANSGRMHFNQSPAADLCFQQANTTTWVFAASGGIYAAGASGGDKGNGKINALEVYDDNTILTCYALEQAIHGSIDLAYWDAISTKETHEPARRFAANSDELDPDVYEGKWRADGHLPNMPTREQWAAGSISTGDLAQRLWEVVEIQAVHIAKLNERLKTIEGRH